MQSGKSLRKMLSSVTKKCSGVGDRGDSWEGELAASTENPLPVYSSGPTGDWEEPAREWEEPAGGWEEPAREWEEPAGGMGGAGEGVGGARAGTGRSPRGDWEEPARGLGGASEGVGGARGGSGRSRRGTGRSQRGVLTCCVPPVAPGSLTPSVPWAELSPEPHMLRGPQESGFSLRKA